MIPAARSPNRERLLRTARRITPHLPDVVFVGGQITELLVTDPAAIRVRPADDVDVVVRVTTRTAYHRLQERLREAGFSPDARPGAPLCRMRTTDDLVLDLMPLDERILGFTNRWYPLALDTALPIALAPDLVIRAMSAPAFLASRWEAFHGRTRGSSLSGVATSTRAPSSASRYWIRLMYPRNVAGPSNSTSRSTSLSGLASSRAYEPNSPIDRPPNRCWISAWCS